MGDWMTVNVVGSIDPADADAARNFIDIGKDWGRFHCMAYTGTSLCGLGPWIPRDGGDINVVGNLSERNYGPDDVAEVLKELVELAPSLKLKVHCGGPYESTECTATVTAADGQVSIGQPEVETVGAGLQDLAAALLLAVMLGGR